MHRETLSKSHDIRLIIWGLRLYKKKNQIMSTINLIIINKTHRWSGNFELPVPGVFFFSSSKLSLTLPYFSICIRFLFLFSERVRTIIVYLPIAVQDDPWVFFHLSSPSRFFTKCNLISRHNLTTRAVFPWGIIINAGVFSRFVTHIYISSSSIYTLFS